MGESSDNITGGENDHDSYLPPCKTADFMSALEGAVRNLIWQMEQAACCVDEKSWISTGWECAKDMVHVWHLKLELMALLTAIAHLPEATSPVPEKLPKTWASLFKGADSQEKRMLKHLDWEITVTI